MRSFEDLESLLREWRSFGDQETYDVAGMMALFCACVDNLARFATKDELDQLSEGLTAKQRDLLRWLVVRKTH